jgi:hypothetical protein
VEPEQSKVQPTVRPNVRPKVRVAYIAGAGFSGSTLLEQALSQIDGCVSVGEPYRPLFEPYWPEMTCGCGELFRDCPFWNPVLEDAYNGEQDATRERLRVLGEGMVAHSVRSAYTHSSPPHSVRAAFREIGALLEPMYRAVLDRTGARVVVDASKTALWGMGILAAPGIELDVVHLVREPRGFAMSNSRPHDFWPPGTQTIPRGPIRSYVNWGVSNVEAEYLARHANRSLTLLYDSFARSPEPTFLSVVEMLGLDAKESNPIHDGVLTVDNVAHTIGGNPRRPRLGTTKIEYDERWKTSGSRTLRLAAPVMTGPLWHHYRRRATRSAPGAR